MENVLSSKTVNLIFDVNKSWGLLGDYFHRIGPINQLEASDVRQLKKFAK